MGKLLIRMLVLSIVMSVVFMAPQKAHAAVGCGIIKVLCDAHESAADCIRRATNNNTIASYCCLKGPVQIIGGVATAVYDVCKSAAAQPAGGVCTPCSTCATMGQGAGACYLTCRNDCPSATSY